MKARFDGSDSVEKQGARGRKLVEGAADCAGELGLKPSRHYKKAARVFGGIKAEECVETFIYGKDGKPFFAPNPDDSPGTVRKVLRLLRARCGGGGCSRRDRFFEVASGARDPQISSMLFSVRKCLVGLAFLLPGPFAWGQVSFGEPIRINEDWRFHRGDLPAAAAADFDDAGWRRLDLPHDWSVEGPYSPDLASGTGYLPGGIAWYRKDLDIPAERRGREVYLYFEGIYRNGEVFVNGESLGIRPNGYISYAYRVTPYLRFGETNVVSVRVDHSKYADSRWYTGSGIYRDVYLVYANPVHLGLWGIHFTTPRVSREDATVEVRTTVENGDSVEAAVAVIQEMVSADGEVFARARDEVRIPAGASTELSQAFEVGAPRLWSPGEPNLYRLRTTLYRNGEPIDRTETRVGIREFRFDADRGLFLNDEPVLVKGVCLHHDAGSLGAAVPREVWERRLRTLRSIGVNAIRTSHNPQAPVLYDLADELGFLVVNEAFDEWEFPKKKWIEGWNVGTPGFDGAAEFFDEWGERDLRDLVLRDRNHPSVFMWSIGNEVDYPNDPYSHPILNEEGIGQQHTWGYLPDHPRAERLGAIAERLAAVVRAHDGSRAVTAGLAGPVMSNETGYPAALDVVGYNYTEGRYAVDHATYPDRVFYGSENGHSMSAWRAVTDHAFVFGQFLWTGIDYLGESGRWPSRGSTSGLLDLAGFKKPRGWFRQSLWADEPMIYIGTYPASGRDRLSIDARPLWNYRSGERIRVVAYTNGDQAELRLNGRPIGDRKAYDRGTGILHWDLPFEEGRLEAVAFRGGNEVARYAIETSGRPHAIRAQAYSREIRADGGVAQIEVRIVDREGRPATLADDEIGCTLEGPVRLLAMESADPRETGNFRDNRQRVYRGRLILYVQATGREGAATVRLNAPWLEGAEIPLVVRGDGS